MTPMNSQGNSSSKKKLAVCIMLTILLVFITASSSITLVYAQDDWFGNLDSMVNNAQNRFGELRNDINNQYSQRLQNPHFNDNQFTFDDYANDFIDRDDLNRFQRDLDEKLEKAKDKFDDRLTEERDRLQDAPWYKNPSVERNYRANDNSDPLEGLNSLFDRNGRESSYSYDQGFERSLNSGMNDLQNGASDFYNSVSGFIGGISSSVSISVTKSPDPVTLASLQLNVDDNEKVRELKQAWEKIPEPVREMAVENTEATFVVPVVYKDSSGHVSAGMSVALISPLEGKLEIYEPEEEALVAVASNSILVTATGGLVSVDKVEKAELEKVSEGRYNLKVDATVRLFGLVPVPMEAELAIDRDTNKVDGDLHVISSEIPWWSVLASA